MFTSFYGRFNTTVVYTLCQLRNITKGIRCKYARDETRFSQQQHTLWLEMHWDFLRNIIQEETLKVLAVPQFNFDFAEWTILCVHNSRKHVRTFADLFPMLLWLRKFKTWHSLDCHGKINPIHRRSYLVSSGVSHNHHLAIHCHSHWIHHWNHPWVSLKNQFYYG